MIYDITFRTDSGYLIHKYYGNKDNIDFTFNDDNSIININNINYNVVGFLDLDNDAKLEITGAFDIDRKYIEIKEYEFFIKEFTVIDKINNKIAKIKRGVIVNPRYDKI